MTKIIIDKQIAHFRKQNGLTQEQLAAALNVSNQAVSKWESAQCCPDISLLPEIAGYFNITVDEILGVITVKNDNIVRLAEYIIEMSVCAYKNGLISLIDYAKAIEYFPFLKTAVDILIRGECYCKAAEEILKVSAGSDRESQLISDCTLVLIRGVRPASIIKILENRLSPQEFAILKSNRPDFFPTRASFYLSIKGRKPLSEKSMILEKLIPYSVQIAQTDMFYYVSDELFTALYGSSEQVIKMIAETLDQIRVFQLAWCFKLSDNIPEDKIIECQKKILQQICAAIQIL